jgi:hypothetical protein
MGQPAFFYSDCRIFVPLQNDCAHRKVLRARINLAPTPVVTVSQSEHKYDNSYKKAFEVEAENTKIINKVESDL